MKDAETIFDKISEFEKRMAADKYSRLFAKESQISILQTMISELFNMMCCLSYHPIW